MYVQLISSLLYFFTFIMFVYLNLNKILLELVHSFIIPLFLSFKVACNIFNNFPSFFFQDGFENFSSNFKHI